MKGNWRMREEPRRRRSGSSPWPLSCDSGTPYLKSVELLHSQCAPSPSILNPSDTQQRHHLAVWSGQMLGKDRTCWKAGDPTEPGSRIQLNPSLPDHLFLVMYKSNSHTSQSGSVDFRLHSEQARPAHSNHCCLLFPQKALHVWMPAKWNSSPYL